MRISDWMSDVCSSYLLATDHAAPHTRLAAERDKALNFALGIPTTGLGAGHLRELHVDLLRREIPARCAVDEASIDPCRKHLAILRKRSRGANDAQPNRERIEVGRACCGDRV